MAWSKAFTNFRGFLLLLAILQGSGLAAALYGPSSDVLLLSPSNFKSKVLQSDGIVFVEFFAPWCGHCKALTPAWEKAAKALKGLVTVAALDADAHQSLAQEYGIKGFPTIKVFGVGKSPIDYQGPRDEKGIVDFAIQQVKSLAQSRLGGKSSKKSGGSNGESASAVLTESNFDELVLDSKDIWLVEFYAPWCGHCKKLAPEWKAAANSLKGKVKLGQVDGDAEKGLLRRYGVEGFPTILVFGADKENPTPYEGGRVASAIESFALGLLQNVAVAPEVVEITAPEVLEKNCGSAAICFVTFLPDILDTKAEGRNKYLEILRTVAEKFKKNAYGYVWAAAGQQPALEKALGVGGYGYPALVAYNVKKRVYAPLRSAFELDAVVKFAFEAGRGGKHIVPVESEPEIATTQAWDGLDGELLEEDEFSLDELMGIDDSEAKDEL